MSTNGKLRPPKAGARAWSYATRWFPAQGAAGKSSRGVKDDSHVMADANDKPVTQNPEKDPDDWTTGDEPMTGPQRSYLQTLCREAKEDFDENLTKAEASKKIEELQARTGRGKEN
jgi:hypothetical protein